MGSTDKLGSTLGSAEVVGSRVGTTLGTNEMEGTAESVGSTDGASETDGSAVGAWLGSTVGWVGMADTKVGAMVGTSLTPLKVGKVVGGSDLGSQMSLRTVWMFVSVKYTLPACATMPLTVPKVALVAAPLLPE